jgi:hypothetical protein
VVPPGPYQRARLYISPFNPTPARAPAFVAGTQARQNQRRSFWEDYAGDVQTGAQRLTDFTGYRDAFRRAGIGPTGVTFGAGGSVAATREQLAELRRFLFATSLDPIFISRLDNVSTALNLLRANESLLTDLGRHPERWGFEDAGRLQAIIVREPWATSILGRRPRVQAEISAVRPGGPTAAEWRIIRGQVDAAESATNVRIPTPIMLTHPDIETILRHFGYVGRCYPRRWAR